MSARKNCQLNVKVAILRALMNQPIIGSLAPGNSVWKAHGNGKPCSMSFPSGKAGGTKKVKAVITTANSTITIEFIRLKFLISFFVSNKESTTL